jgi:serine/threonine-protein kinase
MKFCDKCHSTYPTEFAVCPKDKSKLRVVSDLQRGMELRGKYRIEEKIGEGGMATVYRAAHLHFKEDLAIKVVNSALTANQDFLNRFKREAVITRKLRHPNAVRLDDFDFTEDGRPFIAMEYVRGKSLRQVLQENGSLPAARAFNIARQVALALGAAHELGIVHRDIKPDNIVLVPQPDGSELVKVLDFGIAKVADENLEGTATYKPTSTGMVLGTPHYLSPEQAKGMKSSMIDGRADLYALGVMLYEMLTGELPFKSDTAIEMLLHHIQSAPVPTHLLKPELNIPEPVSQLVMKALEKDPAQRFQTGAEMAAALEDPAIIPAADNSMAGTKTGSRVAAFSTSALAAAAAGGVPAKTAAATSALAAETRVLGSQAMTAQSTTPAAVDAAIARVAGAIAPKRKRWVVWTAAATALLLVSIWVGSVMLSRSSASGNQNDSIPDYNQSQEAPRSSPRRAQPGRRTNPATSQPAASRSNDAANDAAQKAKAQQLVMDGHRRMAQRDYSGAASDYQRALELDPENTNAQRGLRAAQTAQTLQGVGSIFRR